MDELKGILTKAIKKIEINYNKPFKSYDKDNYKALANVSPIQNVVIEEFGNRLDEHWHSGMELESILKKDAEEWDKLDTLFAFIVVTNSDDLTDEFIEEYAHWLDINALSYEIRLSDHIISKFEKQVAWAPISSYGDLTEEFLDRYGEKLMWNQVIMRQKIPETLLRKQHHHFSPYIWATLPTYQDLSERFILDFHISLSMDNVSRYACLSYDFIVNHIELLNVEKLMGNEAIVHSLTEDELETLNGMGALSKHFSC